MTSLQAIFLSMAAFVGFCSGMSIKGPPGPWAFVAATLRALGYVVGGIVAWVGLAILGNLALSGEPDRLGAEAPGAVIFALYYGLMAAGLGLLPTAIGTALGVALRRALNRIPKPERPPAFTPTIPHDSPGPAPDANSPDPS